MSDSSDQEQLWWAKAQTYATFIGLGAILLQMWTLAYDRLLRAKAADPGKNASDENEMSYFRVPKLSWWSAFRGLTTETPRITTLRGLIEAGDGYLWTSAALDHLPPQRGNHSWVALYESIYFQVANQKDSDLATENKDPIIAATLKRARGGLSGTSGERYKLYDNKLISCVRPLDKTEDIPLENYPVHNKEQGLTRLADTWLLRGSACLQTSREELAALALVLGIPLKINDYTQNISGVGPFGTGNYAIPLDLHRVLAKIHADLSGIDIIQDNGVWRLELIHGSRLPRHTASRSSGYSVLFAKHLAFGSLPFAQNKHWVQAVYISPDVLEAIKKGHAIKDGKSFGAKPLQTLKSLPAAKQIDAFYHTGNKDLHGKELGSILNSNDKPVNTESKKATTVKANWCRAVVGIAFGGLVPQASKDLATAVSYTVAGEVFRDVVSDLVDALEHLINKLHSSDPGANIFGDHVTERCTALKLITYVQYATPSRYDTQEAAAVFARYMNLLERMARLSETASVETIFEKACTLIHDVYVEVIERSRHNSRKTALLDRNLVTEIRLLADRFEEHRPVKGLKLDDCTLIVWCVLIVWASRVPHGESVDFIDEVLPDQENRGSKKQEIHDNAPQTRRPVPLTDMPQLMAFS